MKTKITSLMSNKTKSVLVFIVFLALSLNMQAQYCAATGGCNLYISRVEFSNLDNFSSACNSYYDYSTTYTANINQGYIYQIKVSNPNQYSNDTCEVWIDWNKDTIFDNTSEYYRLTNSSYSYVGSILVPLTTITGETRMRIRLRNEGNINSCGDAGQNYGEVEDYTVNITAASNMILGSIIFNQFNGITIPGSQNVKIASIKIVTNGGLNPLYLKNIDLNSLDSYSNIDDARLFYTQNIPAFSMQTAVGTQLISPGNQLLFSDSIPLLPDTNYFWLTYSVSINAPIGFHLKANLDSLNINDSTQFATTTDTTAFVEVVAPLDGNYVINPQGNGDYLSFTDAVNDLIIRGISGPVTFNVDSGTYNEQIIIPTISGTSSINTITFQSSTNYYNVILTHTPTNSSDNFTIMLQNTAYINFYNLTISSGYSYNYSRIISITGSNYINISGNNIIGTQTYTAWDDNMALIYFSGFASSYITVTGNTLQYGSYGILTDAYSMSSENNFSGNTIIYQGGFGIYMNNQSNLIIANNYIYSDLYANSFYGIYFNYGNGNLLINNNEINVRNYSNVYGIYLSDYYGDVQNSYIANNFISLNSSSNYAAGITLNYATIGVYYNSINIYGDNSNTYTLNVQNSYGLVILNNIISNTANGTAISAGTCDQCISDYNNIYSDGNFATINGNINIPNLTTWISAVSVDSNSVSLLPQFFSDTDLHTSNISLNGRAIPISGITNDFDNQLRNSTTPDIGADEFFLPPNDLQIEGFLNLPSGCGLSNNEKIEVIIKNVGDSIYLAGNAEVKYRIDLAQQLANETIDQDIASGDTIHFIFSAGASLAVDAFMHDTTFIIESWIDYPGDMNQTNDSISMSALSRYLPAVPIVSDTVIPYASSVSVNAQLPQDYIPLWYESMTSLNYLKINNPFTTPVLYKPDTVYVSSKKAELDYAIIGSDYSGSSYPFYSYYSDVRSQIIYTAQELQAAGFIAGNITSLAFNVYSQSNTMMNGFTIKMENTSLSNLTAFVETGWTDVYSSSYSVPGYGWQEIVFQTPFVWDGSSNILINICYDNNSYGSNTNVYCTYSPGKTWTSTSSSGIGCNLTGGYLQDYRPNIQLKGTKMGNGCESNRTALHIDLSNIPNHDIGVIAMLLPNSGFEISSPVTVGVVVKNYGAAAIDSMFVSYQKNATSLPVTENVISSLASGDSLIYYFNQTVDISVLGTYNFKAYTQLPGDSIYFNDTIYKTVQNYTYCNPVFSNGCYYSSITNFNINTLLNNNSGCNTGPGSYINYPENTFTTGLQKSITYPFSITSGNNYYSTAYAIWIDFNHDGDFDDAGEFLYNIYTSSLQISGNINIPSTYSYLGKTRMRVRALRYNYLYATNSCTQFSEYGETEDYTITILPEPLQKDLQLISIVKPNNNSYQLISNDVTIKVKNIGMDTITQIPFSYIFNLQTPINFTWNGQIVPQQQTDVNLPQLIPTTANNDITVYTDLAGDMDHSNDTLYKSFTALAAPALIQLNPDTIYGMITSCDSNASQTIPLSISNSGYQPLNYTIIQSKTVNENFESGLSKWVSSGGWGVINQGYNGGYALTESPYGSYGNNWNQSIQLKDSIYIANKDSCKIQYMLKRNMESCCDYLYTQISVNGGSWTTLSPSYNGTEDWNLKQFNFKNNVNNGDYIKFRFQFTSDYSVTGDGVLIDNLIINGIANGSWATLSKSSDTVAIGDTSIVNVTFKVGQLNAGTHSQLITILSNDPISSNLKFPLYLTIIGGPQILIKDSIRNFPSIMAGVVASETFKIYNIGCDSLKINAVNHTDNAFTPFFPSYILPRDSGIITFNFSSLTQGLHKDTITILSNSDIKHLYLSGTVLPTPQLIVQPDSFIVNSNNCNDTLNRSLLIKNTGNTTMSWNAYFSKGAEKALSFNGSSSQLRLGNLGQMPQKGSVEFWMKANSNSGFKLLYSSSGLNNWRGVNIYQSDNYLYLIIGNDIGSYYQSYLITNNIDYGKWHHIAVSWDISQNKIWTYFDGNVINNASYNSYWPTTTADVRLGIGYNSSSSYFFNGQIDELRLWRENRSATEIQSLYKQALVIPSPGLIGLWGFNEASGDTVRSFNNNNYGVLYNITRVNSGAKIENPGIDVYPINGVLANGDSSNLSLTFITTGLNSGFHYSGIGITSNDPLHQLVIIPTYLYLSGNAQLQLLTNNLNINSIMAGASITDSMLFVNTGCDTLKVTNITHNSAVFNVNQTVFNVLPKDTAKLKITFNPITVGSYNDTLQFVCNGGNQQLYVHAVAVAAPIASVSPASFIDTLTLCNHSITKYFKIKNTGNEILSWNGLMGGVGMSDNFDNGINMSKWSSITNGTSASSCGTALGNNALYFGGDGTRAAITNSLNTLGGGNITFYIKISGSGGSPCEQADYGEDVVMEYSINNGTSWNLIQTFSAGSYSYFTPIQTLIPINAQSFNTRFRWRQLTHSGACCDHWSIDEVNINTVNINNINPSSGIVPIGDSTVVELIVEGQGLINGNYLSQLLINTNDPVHLLLTIPVQIIVRANPIITVANNPVIMDTVMIGALSSKSLYIKNTGCDSLKITNITHNLTEFTVTPLTFTILPKDSAAVNLSFSSLTIGNYVDTLKIFNNAGNINIPVKAKAVGAPAIISQPDQITADFACDSQVITALKLKNPGIVALNWSAFISNQEKGALQFNGVNNYVSLGYLSPGNKWTVEAWVKPDVLSYGNKLIAGSGYSNAPWGICMVDSRLAAIYKSASGSSQTLIADNVTITAGVWYHLACAFNGTNIRLYINGQLVKSAIANSNYNTYSYPIIGGDPGYLNYFSGSIDEVRIWDRERSQSQISYAMNHILAGNESGLLGYWPFNKVNGITVTDFSGNGHNGTINGASFSVNASPSEGWVNLSNYSGVINVGDSTQINLSINRHLLTQGPHPFKLIIQSDDPVKPFDTTLITVNVQYNLTPVDIGSDTNFCSGNGISISAGNYASYNWSNNTHNPNITIANSGTYNVLVTDINGCMFSDTIQVGITQPPLADGGLDKSVCQNNSVSLNGSANGGTPPYQYVWKNEGMSIVSNLPNYAFTPSVSLKYYLYVTDNNGCTSLNADTINITVNPKPIVSAGNDTVINLGTSAFLNGSVSGGTYPYTFLWSPADYLSATNIINPVASPIYSNYYTLTVTDANNCSANENTYVQVKYTIAGSVLYNNSSLTPIPNAWVYLENSSTLKKDSVLTSATGSFLFSKVDYAYYYIYAKPTAVFGGINSTDALGIRRHIVNLAALNGVNLNAADVNKSNTVSSADALQVLRRTIGLISSFTSGDWTSERLTLYYISTNIQNVVIKVLCMGDVNGSYNIYSTKSTKGSPELQCIPTNKNLIAGETFTLPISVKQKIKPGAITLHLQFPNDLIDIINVTSNGHDIDFNTQNGILSIGIYDEKGILLNDNILLSVTARVKPDAPGKSIGISLSDLSEIADIDGKVISGLQLEVACLNIVEKNNEFVMEDNYPNPFSAMTTVRIYVPEEASVRLSVINTLGVEIKSMATKKLSIGWHELQIDAGDITQGAYMYRLQAIASNRTFEQTRRMMIIR